MLHDTEENSPSTADMKYTDHKVEQICDELLRASHLIDAYANLSDSLDAIANNSSKRNEQAISATQRDQLLGAINQARIIFFRLFPEPRDFQRSQAGADAVEAMIDAWQDGTTPDLDIRARARILQNLAHNGSLEAEICTRGHQSSSPPKTKPYSVVGKLAASAQGI